VRLNIALTSRGNDCSPHFATPLDHAHNDCFILRAGAGDFLPALVGVHIAGLAADEGFIRFDLARELVECASVHRMTNPVEHEPCRLLRNVDVARDFIRANAVLAVGNQEHRAEPLVEADWRVFEDRPDLDGELFFAIQALPHQPCVEERGALALAARADCNAIVPAERREELNAGERIREKLDGFHQGCGHFHIVRHESIVLEIAG